MDNGSDAVVIAVVIACFIAFSAVSEAKTVTMNLAFSFSGDKADTIRANETSYLGTTTQERTFAPLGKKFISAERGSAVMAMVFAGSEFISAQLNTSHSSSTYMLGMSQDDAGNRLLLVFTTGAWGSIDSKALDVESFGFAPKAFGNVAFAVPEMFQFFIRLEYRNVDFLNRTVFRGPARLFMTNAGRAGSVTNVTTEVK